jgi:hypothetical protein
MRVQLDQIGRARRSNERSAARPEPAAPHAAAKLIKRRRQGASMLGQMSQMVAECPALEARRDQAPRRRPAEIAGLVFSTLLMSPYPPVAGELAVFDILQILAATGAQRIAWHYCVNHTRYGHARGL